MKRLRNEIRALRREVSAMRVSLYALESEIHRLRNEKMDNIITAMRQSAREMLRLSREL
jgi:hypothetical protein